MKRLPVHATADMAEELAKQAQWDATLIAGSRRVWRGTSIFRFKAQLPPAREVWRTTLDGEMLNVQVAKTYARKFQTAGEGRPSSPPDTWQASAKQTLGVQRPNAWSKPVEDPTEGDEPFEENGDMDAEDNEDLSTDEVELDRPRTAWSRRLPEPAPKIATLQKCGSEIVLRFSLPNVS